MGNRELLDLFLQGVDAWNNGVDPWGTKSEDRVIWDPAADLSNVPVGNLVFNRSANGDSGLRQATDFPGIQMMHSNLQGTQFQLPDRREVTGFNFSQGDFSYADLTGSNLKGANLTRANFYYAKLRNAALEDAVLEETDLSTADLTGADLTATRPWRARLFSEPPRFNDPGSPTLREIGSVADLIKACLELGRNSAGTAGYSLYYRGQVKGWTLRPSVMRHGTLRENEGQMLVDMMTRRPEDFAGMDSALDQWVLAQHHGLRTRLLDVTRNPLVALYFACERAFEDIGLLHVFAVPKDMVKPYNSDTVSIIANFAKLSHSEQPLLLGKHCGFDRQRQFYSRALTKLYHHVGTEKSHFQHRMDPRDLFHVYLVEPRQSVERLRAQSGAFLISAFHERFERRQIVGWNEYIPAYDHQRLVVPANRKEDILDELRLLNITREALYPGLDETANAVTQRYG